MTGRRVIFIIIGLVLICMVTIFAVKRLNKDATGIAVECMEIIPQPFTVTVSAEGTIEPTEVVEARSELIGKVNKIFVKIGDKVEKGQVIASIEKSDLEAQLQQAKSQVAAVEAELIQLESQTTEDLGGTFAVRQAEIQLHAAKIRLEELLKGPSESQIIQAESQVVQAEIALRDGKRQLEAMDALYEEGAISKTALEDAKAKVENANVQYQSLKKQYESLCEGPSKEQVELLEAQVAEAEIAVALAKEQEISKKKTKEAAKARLAQANANLKLVEDALLKTAVISCENGIITDIPIKEGAVVTEGMPIAVIATDKGMRVKARIDETDIAQIKIGQHVTFTTDAIWDVEFYGIVSEISPQAIYGGLTPGFIVLIDINEPTENLRSGMSADVEIATYNKENALVVPVQAIVEKDAKEAIFLIDKNGSKVRVAHITTGLYGPMDVEVLEGISEGDQVVTGDYNALKQLHDGKQVKVNEGRQDVSK